jgi:Na+/H+-dicarboxylate symporter
MNHSGRRRSSPKHAEDSVRLKLPWQILIAMVRAVARLKLHWQILIAMVLGAAFALVFGEVEIVARLAEIFMRLLRMIIAPLILTSIVSGVASIGDGKTIGRLGLKTLAYYGLSSLLAIVVGLTVTNLIRPGVGVDASTAEPISPDSLQTPGSLWDILVRLIPTNPFEAAAEFDILGLIFFALCAGVAISLTSGRSRDLFSAGFDVMMTLTGMVLRLLPVGVFALIATAIGSMGIEVFAQVGKYMLTIALGLSIHFLVVLPGLFFLFTRINPLRHYKAVAPAMAMAFSTSSSSATLPVTIESTEKNVGVSNRIASFVLPMGSTVNMDGTALYECAGALFIAQALGIDLSIQQQMVVVLTALLASIGAAGIPSAGLVMIFIVLEAIGLNNPASYALVGLMLGVDRPLDMFRTVVNVTSDTVGAAIIANSEGERLSYSDRESEEPAP